MKRLYLMLLVATATIIVQAAAPNGSGNYYSSANGKKGAELKTALCGIIYTHTQKSYDDLWTAFQTTDVRSDGKVWDMYSDNTNYVPGGSAQGANYSKEGDSYNREHSFPKSWFGGEVMPMYTDLHHMYPTDGYVNNKRGNYPFGETNGNTYKSHNSFSKLGTCTVSGYTETVFEPADEYKGDFARTYFYMVTCYENQIVSWYNNYSSTEVKDVLDGKTYPGLSTWQLNMLLAWAAADPVSDKEVARNTAVKNIQGNRNPFIDYPGLEQYIWGSKKDDTFSYDNYDAPEGAVTQPESNTEGDITITFSTGSGDGTEITTSTACSTIVSEGASYLSGNVAAVSKAYRSGSYGLKLGTSSAAGTIKMNLASSMTPTSIVVRAKRYNSSNAATISVNGQTAQNLTADFADYTFTFDGSSIDDIELSSSKYCWVSSITIHAQDETTQQQHTATFSVNGNTSSISVQEGNSITFPNDPDDINGKTFVGWVTSAIDGTTNTAPSFVTSATMGNADVTYYAVFAVVTDGGSGSYTLDYNSETDLSSSSSWGSYGKAYNYTASDGSTWTIKAYKSQGMQLNTGKNCSVKVPDCPSNITSISVTCGSPKAVGFSASDYNGSGTISYLAEGSDTNTQTFDLSAESVTTGYIVPKGGATAIRKIIVNYGNITYSDYCTTVTSTVAVSGVSVAATASVNVGETTTLTATISPDNATNKNVTWTSSDETVATVDADGVVTGVAAGTATITVTSVADNTKKATCTVTVTAASGTSAYTVADVEGQAEATTLGNNIYVTGYIVGCVKDNKCYKTTTDNFVNTNLLLADTPNISFTEGANVASNTDGLIPVELPNTSIRTNWNVVSNNVIGYKVILKGNAQAYFGTKAIKGTSEISAVSVPVTVGAAGYTTYTTADKMTMPSGVTAYIATAVNTNTIHLEEVTNVPANTPIILKAVTGTYYLPVITTSTDDVSANLLLSSDGTVTGGENIYALSKNGNVVGFNPVSSGVTIPKGKAYLDLSSNPVKGFLSFDFGSTDGINAMDNGQWTMDNAQIFNLAGQRVSKAKRGLYIVNGKKVLVK